MKDRVYTFSFLCVLCASFSLFASNSSVPGKGKKEIAQEPEVRVKKIAAEEAHKNKEICEELSRLAIQEGNIDVLERLVKDVNFNSNATDNVGMSLLHYAAKLNFLPGVSLLLNHGAHVNAINDLLMTPLHYAVKNGNLEIARTLLARGADSRLANKKGFTPLLLLVLSNKSNAEKMLCSPTQMFDLLTLYAPDLRLDYQEFRADLEERFKDIL